MKLAAGLLGVMFLALVGCGGDSQSGAVDAEAEPESSLVAKLKGCISEWNDDERAPVTGAVSANEVLVTTSPDGNCQIAYSAPEDYGNQLPMGMVWDRTPEGEWRIVASSDLSEHDFIMDLQRRLNDERIDSPNAILVEPGPYLEYIDDAPLPAGAQAEPSLIINPTTETCDEVLTFTGGAIGDFYLTVEEAAGISCERVAQIANDFPSFVAEWSCGGERRLECRKGNVSFTVVRRDGSPESRGPDSSESEDPVTTPERIADGSRCGAIRPHPNLSENIAIVKVKGVSCFEVANELLGWAYLNSGKESYRVGPGPYGWECDVIPDPGRSMTKFECSRGSSILNFDASYEY